MGETCHSRAEANDRPVLGEIPLGLYGWVVFPVLRAGQELGCPTRARDDLSLHVRVTFR